MFNILRRSVVRFICLVIETSYRYLVCISSAISLSACVGPGLSPPQLVGDQQSDLAVKEFLYAGQILARFYGFELYIAEDSALAASLKRGSNTVFGFPLKSDVPYVIKASHLGDGPPSPYYSQNPLKNEPFNAIKYYIKTGYYASSILCRNYLSGMSDRNAYFQFLQKELNNAQSLTGLILGMAQANGTLTNSISNGLNYFSLGVDAYRDFRFLAPDIEAILPVVAIAQAKLRDHYVDKGLPSTFSGAINAVSNIEFQCSRTGIRKLLNKSLSSPQFNLEVREGILFPIVGLPTSSKPDKQ